MTRDSSVFVLIPVHNRRETTRTCLNRLRDQGGLEQWTVCVVDDGCTDGTTAMLADDFPLVRRIPGNGDLFWGGGIMLGMRQAREEEAEVMVWLNDDCLPAPGAIGRLVERVRTTKGICGGICHDPAQPEEVTYSGTLLGSGGRVVPAAGGFAAVDLINGNLVAVHREVVRKLGLIPGDKFPHYGGDSIYALRARRAGIACEVDGGARATNPPNAYFERFGRSKPAWHLLKEPFRTGSVLYWPSYWRFIREAFGWQAWVRWPFYFVRLARQLAGAFGRSFASP